MKSTLKLILVSMVLSIGILSAQTYRLEVGFVSPKQSGAEFSTNYFNGGRLGVTAEFGLKHNFSLLTGALYSLVYSNKVQYYSSTDSVTYKTFGHSIDIPLRLTYTLPLSKNLKVFGFAGPNINVGIAQPRKTTAVLSSSLREVIDEFGNVPTNGTEDLYKSAMISRINFQMGAGGGVQWKNYQLKGGYDFGINSINKVDTSKLFRQGGWYVSLVYQF
ncbi:MAG: outer membrane beta-barrel protein [Paludibacter sp.]|nr:outer membrane beta-barrel protein [Paludibacter sp.]